MQELHYGDVLFHFYQQDYFDSLVSLAAYREQGRLAAHARDAELLSGGLYLSLGQHREAREVFERLLADATTPADVKSRAWFYLGKLLYASGEYEESDRALRQSAGTLAEEWPADSRGMASREAARQSIKQLFDAGSLEVGDRVIFTSGDHMEHHGATNTLRLLQVGEGGTAEGLGEL